MRAVFDTNVIISGLLWVGTTSELIRFVDSRKIILCVTPKILSELTRVLAYPKFEKMLRRAYVSRHEIIAYILEYALLFEDVSLVTPIVDDPSDNMFVNCAIVSGSKWIISGDQHLLRLKTFGGISILKPKIFLETYHSVK